jgi:membrane-associated protein
MIEARGPTTSHHRRALVIGVGVASAVALLALAVFTGMIDVPSLGALLEDLSDSLGHWAYLLVPGLAFFETAAFLGIIVPGETAVVVGGVVAERGEVTLPVLVLLVWSAAVAGDVLSFLLGRRLGRPFTRRHASRLHIKAEHLDRIERLFERHGGMAIVIGRFVGVLRAFTPFVAGASGMRLRRFLPFSVAAAFAWATLFTLLGYAFANAAGTVGDAITKVSIPVAVVVGLVLWVRRSPKSREASTRPPRAPGSEAARGVTR